MTYAEFAVPSVFKMLLAFLSKNEDVFGMDLLAFVPERLRVTAAVLNSVNRFSVIHRFSRGNEHCCVLRGSLNELLDLNDASWIKLSLGAPHECIIKKC